MSNDKPTEKRTYMGIDGEFHEEPIPDIPLSRQPVYWPGRVPGATPADQKILDDATTSALKLDKAKEKK
jgi:hypothetical protein